MPFFRSLVVIAGMVGASGPQILGQSDRRVLRRVGEGLAPVRGDDARCPRCARHRAGKVHAGLDGDDVAGRQQGIDRRSRHAGCLVDLEADAVAGACTNASPHPASAMTLRGTRRRRRGTPTPAATAATPAALRRGHDFEHARRVGAGIADETVRVMSEQ